eukprot:188794_1
MTQHCNYMFRCRLDLLLREYWQELSSSFLDRFLLLLLMLSFISISSSIFSFILDCIGCIGALFSCGIDIKHWSLTLHFTYPKIYAFHPSSPPKYCFHLCLLQQLQSASSNK